MASVSVIIPVYNTEEYIEQCLDSVISQTLSDIEIICVLDGPSDQSGLIAKRYAEQDSRIVIIEQANTGLSAARNAGLKRATGKYISFIDSDDWVSPEFIEKLYESARATGADMAICNFYYYRNCPIPGCPIPDGIHDPRSICRELILDKVIKNYAWNKLISKEIFDKYNILFPVGLLFEDIAIMCQIAYRSSKVSVINEYLYFYRSRPDSIMNTYNPKQFLDMFKALKRVKVFLLDENLYHLYQLEYEYNCIGKLLGAAKTISKKNSQLIYLFDELKNIFDDLLDGKQISSQTKQLLSTHNRFSLRMLNLNHNFFVFLASRKWI